MAARSVGHKRTPPHAARPLAFHGRVMEYCPIMDARELEELLARYRAGAEAERGALRQQIEEHSAERTVLVGDMAGFTRRVAEDGIVHFLSLIYELRAVCRPLVAEHGGWLFKTDADNVFAVFPDAAAGLHAATALQRALHARNASLPPREQIAIGIGLAQGAVLLVEGEDVWGQALNLASKLGEDLAGPEEILVHESLRPSLAGLGLRGEPRQVALSHVVLCYDRLEWT